MPHSWLAAIAFLRDRVSGVQWASAKRTLLQLRYQIYSQADFETFQNNYANLTDPPDWFRRYCAGPLGDGLGRGLGRIVFLFLTDCFRAPLSLSSYALLMHVDQCGSSFPDPAGTSGSRTRP